MLSAEFNLQGKDITINVKDTAYVLLEKLQHNGVLSVYGCCHNGEIKINLEDAEQLLESLQKAIKNVKTFYKEYEDYMLCKLCKEKEKKDDSSFPNISGIMQR
jgi:hypothetical protein